MPRRINWRKARARANEAAAGAKTKKSRTESCGNDGPVETVESQKQASPCFHRPLEISPRAGEIPTFPQLRRRGGWKSGKPKTGFPLSHRHLFMPKQKKRGPPGGLRPPPAVGASLHLRVKK